MQNELFDKFPHNYGLLRGIHIDLCSQGPYAILHLECADQHINIFTLDEDIIHKIQKLEPNSKIWFEGSIQTISSINAGGQTNNNEYLIMSYFQPNLI